MRKKRVLKDFSSQGFVIGPQHMRDDKRRDGMYLFNICREEPDGEKIDRWLPVRPERSCDSVISCKL